MATGRITLKVDDSKLTTFVTSVKKSEKTALRRAFSSAIRPIVTATRAGIKKSRYNIAKMTKGVRGGAWRDAKGASVYIRTPRDNWFKLLFFEGGAKNGRRRKSGSRPSRTKRGKKGGILAGNFFTTAIASRQSQAPVRFEDSLKKWIAKHETN